MGKKKRPKRIKIRVPIGKPMRVHEDVKKYKREREKGKVKGVIEEMGR